MSSKKPENNASSKDKKQPKKRPWWKRILRILAKTVVVLLIVLIALLLFIRSPWGQNIIVGKLTDYVSGKTHTEVRIKKLFITFSGKLDLEGLYLEDQQGDTLLYSKELKAAVPLWPIIKGQPISINRVDWKGVRANVTRQDSVQGYNFQFIIDAFASDSTTTAKDTTESSPPKIALGRIDFSDFKLHYNDQVSGLDAQADLGKLHFKGKNFDLEAMRFEVDNFTLENTSLSYEQTKPFPPEAEEDTTSGPLPFLSAGELRLKNINLHYKSAPDSLTADAAIGDFKVQVPKADLAKQDIDVKELALLNSSAKLTLKGQNSPDKNTQKPAQKEAAKENITFPWPDWNVQVESIAFENDHFHYQAGKPSAPAHQFDPDNIEVNDFVFKADQLKLSRTKKLSLNLNDFSFEEAGGFKLNQLAFALSLDPEKTELDHLKIKTNNSNLSADLKASYPSLNGFINHPDDSGFAVDLNHFSLNLTDAFYFQPNLKRNEYINKLSRRKITGNLKARGRLKAMDLSKLLMKWGGTTRIQTQGKFKNLTDADKLVFTVKHFDFRTVKRDVTTFISEKDLGISVPESIHLTSRVSGGLDNLKTQTLLQLPEGKINVKGRYKNTDKLAFKGRVNVEDLNLGKILQNPKIGQLGFTMEAEGEGHSLEDLTGKLSSEFNELNYNNYDYSALQLNGQMENGQGNIQLNYKDYNLDLTIDSEIDLDSVAKKVAVDFNLNGADLYALGWTDKKIKAKMIMTAKLKSQQDNLDIKGHIDEGTAVYDKNTYHLGKVDLDGLLHRDSTAVTVNSDFLNADLQSNANIDSIEQALAHHFKRYFYDSLPQPDTITHPVRLKLDMDFVPNELLTDLFVPDIQSMDTLRLKVDYDERESLLTSKMSLPYLDYADKTIDSLQFNLDASKDAGKFKFGFKKLDAGAFVMNPTFFDGELKNGKLTLNFESLDKSGDKFYASQTELSAHDKILKIHVVPDKLIIKGEDWDIPEDNTIQLKPKEIVATDFTLSHQRQSLKIANDLMKVEKNNIGIGFKNFKLASLMALFNSDNYLAKGNLQGNIVAVSPLKKLGVLADFGIDSLQVLKAPLGDLSLKAKTDKKDQYHFNMGLKGDDVDLDVKGLYAAEDPAHFKLNLTLDKFGFKTISKLAGDQLKDGGGYLSGKITADGPVNSPDYKGYFQFHEAHFKVTQLNETFYLTQDKINLDKEGLRFNNFSVEDKDHNTFTLDGSLITEDFTDPEFDLTVKADNFQPMNSSEKDNEDYYGKINFDLDGTIKGKMSFPKVDLDIDVNKDTDFTYVLSESQAAIEKREGIVEFVNKAHPDNILTRTSDSSNVAKIKGIQLHARINIDKKAAFGVVIDPRTGDNLKISGEGGLDFRIAQNGQMSLSGRYTINDGHYKMSLYNLVKREFEFKPGSSITWHGDPMDASLDVTAVYKIKTSASGLMASQTAGASTEERNKYKQVLPFLVLLKVKGTIDKPDLNFGLDMPEGSKGAIGGSVYGRINQLNEEDQGEINKQVFSLLVLNRFYPEGGSDGSQGGVARMARNNLNQALSDQLNNFSNKLMGDTGIQLNFGVNSYTDYQGKSAQDRTDLNVSAQKKLFNDRLVVKAGTEFNVQGEARPGEENPVLGNVSVEYLLTKDGRWRIRGFRKNEYENVIDGQVFVNGIGLLFQRQFNTLHELFISFFGHPEKGKEKEKKQHKKSKKAAAEHKKNKAGKNHKEPEKQTH